MPVTSVTHDGPYVVAVDPDLPDVSVRVLVRQHATLAAQELAETKIELLRVQRERDELRRWKGEFLEVESWWKKVDDYVRNHRETMVGATISDTALKRLKERDELKFRIEVLLK